MALKFHTAIMFVSFSAAFALVAESAWAAPDISEERRVILESYVLATPVEATESVDELSRYVNASPADTEQEKAWVIYRWLNENIRYDVESLSTENVGDVSPEATLRTRMGVCSGYASLFSTLARRAGLEVANIPGYSKGRGVGSPSGKPDHEWNAVKVRGEWRLLDATWGSGATVGRRYEKSEREQSDYFFFTPPEQLVSTHYPADSKWLLTKTTITKSQFDAMILARPRFHYFGMKAVSHNGQVIEAERRFEVVLEAPMDVKVFAWLFKDGKKIDGASFSHRDGNKAIIVVDPVQGDCQLSIFAKRGSVNGAWEDVLHYSLKSPLAEPAAGFPQAFVSFKEELGMVLKPLVKQLRKGNTYAFRIRAPSADKLYFSNSFVVDEYQPLKKNGDVFEGEFTLSRQSNHAAILAQFPGHKSAEGFLAWEVIDGDE